MQAATATTIMPRVDAMVTVLRDPALAAAAIAAAEDPLLEVDGSETDTTLVEEAVAAAEEDAIVVVVLVVGLGFSAVGSIRKRWHHECY